MNEIQPLFAPIRAASDNAEQPSLAIFELLGPMNYAGAADPFGDDPTPRALGQVVWCQAAQAASNISPREYRKAEGTAPQWIWFPLARHDVDGLGVGPPIAAAGTRVLCVRQPQSGRWEAVQGPPYHLVCLGKLDGALAAGGSATVSLWWDGSDSGLKVEAHDWRLKAGTSLAAGAKVMVEYFPQDDRWWVTATEET